MTRALIKNYLHLPNRYEIVVVAGVNKEMEVLKSVVADHSKKWRHSPPSFAVFCTVIVPPKFCSLTVPANPPEPEIAQWVPPSNFRNRYPELKKLNSMVIDMNNRDNLTTVRLDYIGVKRFIIFHKTEAEFLRPNSYCFAPLSTQVYELKPV